MAVSPDKALTARQTKFAAAIANGTTKAQALRENYKPNAPKYAAMDRKKATVLSRAPHVAAEIRRLTWLSCPPADDIRGMREHSIRVLSDLSRTAKSEQVRLTSALALYKIAETTRAAANPRASDREQDRLLDALRGIYRTLQAKAGAMDVDLSPMGVPPNDDDEPIDIHAIGDPEPAADAAEPSADESADEPTGR